MSETGVALEFLHLRTGGLLKNRIKNALAGLQEGRREDRHPREGGLPRIDFPAISSFRPHVEFVYLRLAGVTFWIVRSVIRLENPASNNRFAFATRLIQFFFVLPPLFHAVLG